MAESSHSRENFLLFTEVMKMKTEYIGWSFAFSPRPRLQKLTMPICRGKIQPTPCLPAMSLFS